MVKGRGHGGSVGDVSPLVVLGGVGLGGARGKRTSRRRRDRRRNEHQGGMAASFAVYCNEAAGGEDVGLPARAGGSSECEGR